MKQVLSILGIAIILASCNSDYKKTKSGLAYKIFKGNSKEKLKAGEILKVFVEVRKTGGKDSVFFSNFGKMPEYFPYDTSAKNNHEFTEVLQYCSPGDSLITIAQIDTLVKRGALQYNETFKRRDQIVTRMKIVQVFNTDEARTKDQQAEGEKEKSREVAEVKAYLDKNGIKAQQTTSGAFVEIKNAGNEVKAANGKQATIMYKGTLMKNGVVFDTNMDSAFKHTDPLPVVVGTGQVIPAWEEALPLFGVGGTGRIFVPALLAYGPSGRGPIPPYSNLIFDIQVKSVGDAPKQQPQQQMDPKMMEQLQKQMQQQQQQQQPPK